MDKYSCSENEDDAADRLILNVGGVKFETYMTTLQNISDTRLAWLIENTDPETLQCKEFFFDRHPGAFVHILNFYRTGKLHTPTDICGPAFEEELQFWGIDEKQMEPCCWEKFTKHREAEENLRSFEGPGFEDLRSLAKRKISITSSDFGPSNCHCINLEKVWNVLDDPYSSKLARRFSLLSCFMIIISVSAYCLGTMRPVKDSMIIKCINYICLAFFTLEFVARVICTPDRKEFIQDYKNWIDFLSVIPSYLWIALPNIDWIRNLVIIRVLRVFKFFKLSYGLQVLVHTLKASSYELTLLLFILLIPVVIFSSMVYAAEHGFDGNNTNFDSIPRTFWWCIITMTTVGYGDLTPKTVMGQIIGSVCSICGVLIVALPISVIGSNFSLYYAHVRARLKLPKKNRTLLQGNLRGLLKQPSSLSSRDRDRKTLKRNAHNAIRRKTDQPISPGSYQLQLRRKNLFDQISNNSYDSDYLDTIDTQRSNTSSRNKINNFDPLSTENILQNANLQRSRFRGHAVLHVDLSDSESMLSEGNEKTSLLENSNIDTNLCEFTNNSEKEEGKTEIDVDKNNEVTLSSPKSNNGEIKIDIKDIQNEDDSNGSPKTNTTQSKNESTIGDEISKIYEGVQKLNRLYSPSSHSLNTTNVKGSNSTKSINRLMKKNKIKSDVISKQSMDAPKTRARRGALALLTPERSSDESDGEYTFEPSSENKRICLDLPQKEKEILHKTYSESAADLIHRRSSMKMIISFGDLHKQDSLEIKHKPLSRTTSCNPKIGYTSKPQVLSNSLFHNNIVNGNSTNNSKNESESDIELGNDKSNNNDLNRNTLSLDCCSNDINVGTNRVDDGLSKLKRSRTENYDPLEKNIYISDPMLNHKVKSESDIRYRTLLSSKVNNHVIKSLKESGV